MKKLCLLKRLYDNYSYIIGPVGWAVMIIFVAGMNWNKVQAYEERLVKVEAWQDGAAPKIDKIDQKLDDLIAFWQVPRKQ